MQRTAVIFAILLAIGSVVLKLANPALPENFSIFYALALFCGCFLRGHLAFVLPVGAIFFSDIVGHWIDDYQLGIYGSLAMILNYAGFAVMSGLGVLIRENRNLARVAGASLVGAALFFVISNFGAFLDPRMGHTASISGLLQCYSDAIPFARGTFASSLLFSVSAFAAYEVFASAYANGSEKVLAKETTR